MIVIVAEQLVFLEALLTTVSRKRRFARGQRALGQPQEFGYAAGAPRPFLVAQNRYQPPQPIERGYLFEHFVQRLAATLGDMIPAEGELAHAPASEAPATRP